MKRFIFVAGFAAALALGQCSNAGTAAVYPTSFTAQPAFYSWHAADNRYLSSLSGAGEEAIVLASVEVSNQVGAFMKVSQSA